MKLDIQDTIRQVQLSLQRYAESGEFLIRQHYQAALTLLIECVQRGEMEPEEFQVCNSLVDFLKVQGERHEDTDHEQFAFYFRHADFLERYMNEVF